MFSFKQLQQDVFTYLQSKNMFLTARRRAALILKTSSVQHVRSITR